jgi:hypothetical protein
MSLPASVEEMPHGTMAVSFLEICIQKMTNMFFGRLDRQTN